MDENLRSGNCSIVREGVGQLVRVFLLTGVTKWTSELTIVRLGVMLNSRPLSCSFGRMRRARRNVETTLTVTIRSQEHAPRSIDQISTYL